MCLINQSKEVEVSKFVSLHVEAPPAFMDTQERGQDAGKKKYLASRLGIHGCGERREDFG